jgi:hypothetical protein
MTIATTKAKALLVEIANSLSTEATAAGKTSLATALTELGTEISSQSVTEQEFFINADSSATTGATGVGQVWADVLSAAADVVHSKQVNTANAQNSFGNIKLYQNLIEEGRMLDQGDKVSDAQQANAKAKVKQIANQVQALLDEITNS